MDHQPAAHSSSSPLFRLWPWLVILLVLLLTAFIRFRLLDLPLERDEGEYAYAGQLMLQGIPPYDLAYNMKLPGTYFAYALGMSVFGQTTAGVHLTLLAANSLTVIFVFLLGRKLFGVTAGLVAGASYAVMSVSPAVLGMAAHANHFVVLFAVPATWWLWRYGETRRSGPLFVSGLLYGLAFLMKQQGVCFFLFGCFFLVWQEWKPGTPAGPGFAKRLFCFGGGMALPFALTCLYLAWSGVFATFWFWTFTYAGSYAAHEPWREGVRNLFNYVHEKWPVYLGFLILIALGLPPALRLKADRSRLIFGISFLLFSFLGTAIGLYFRAHYFILTLPALALVTGMAAAAGQRAGRFRAAKLASGLLIAAVLGWNLYFQRGYFFQQSTAQLCRMVYGANPLVESEMAAQYIREHSPGDARIAVIGSEPQIYFYSQRRSATGFLYTYALMEQQPYALKMQREMIREIETNRPEYLVLVLYRYSWLLKDASDPTIIGWSQAYAKKFYETTGIINRRADGEIEALWGDAAKNYPGPFEQFLTVYKRRE